MRYYENHNTEQTAKEFVISKQTDLRYAKQYDGTDDSLMDRRKKRNRKSSYTAEEEEKLFASLKEHNQIQRKRNVITPSYTEIYHQNHECKGKQSYISACKKAVSFWISA